MKHAWERWEMRAKFWSGNVTGRDHSDDYDIDKVKVKLSLCFNWAPRHEDVLGEWRYSSTYSLISALDGDEWSASRLGRFNPRKRVPGTP
jgi:hypothetical protein